MALPIVRLDRLAFMIYVVHLLRHSFIDDSKIIHTEHDLEMTHGSYENHIGMVNTPKSLKS